MERDLVERQRDAILTAIRRKGMKHRRVANDAQALDVWEGEKKWQGPTFRVFYSLERGQWALSPLAHCAPMQIRGYAFLVRRALMDFELRGHSNGSKKRG